jgi:hypothetical protein
MTTSDEPGPAGCDRATKNARCRGPFARHDAYTLYRHRRGNQSRTVKALFAQISGLPVGLRMAAARQA